MRVFGTRHSPRRSWAVPLVLAALLTFGMACGGDDEPELTPSASPALTVTVASAASATREASPTITPTPTPEPTATPVPRPEANPFPDDLREESLEVMREIAAARGIEDPEPVDMFVLTRDQARRFYASDAPDDSAPRPTPTPGPRPLDARQELYELLGLVPEVVPGTDTPTVDQSEDENLISIATAFYDPTFKAFYMIETIAGGIYGPTARASIAHELTHALQFQTVDVNALVGERVGNFDAMTALRATIEGDAINTELNTVGYAVRFTLRTPLCFEIPPSRGAGAPPVIERELDTLYEDGYCFVSAVAGADLAAAQRVMENPPETMEQLLHPEKYVAGEPAQPIAPKPLEGALSGDWRQLGNGTFGEFGLQNTLLNGLAEDRARVADAAAGWGGDAWYLYVDGDARLLQLETVWDTDADAPQFLEGLVASLEGLGFSSQVEGSTTTLTREDVTWSLALRDDSVMVLVGNDEAAIEQARETLALR